MTVNAASCMRAISCGVGGGGGGGREILCRRWRVAAMAATRQRLHSISRPPPPPPPTPQEIARIQLAAFTVIGSYIKKNTRVVFLARGEEILTVRIGNHLMPGYTVVAIHDEQLKLRSDDGRHELILAL